MVADHDVSRSSLSRRISASTLRPFGTLINCSRIALRCRRFLTRCSSNSPFATRNSALRIASDGVTSQGAAVPLRDGIIGAGIASSAAYTTVTILLMIEVRKITALSFQTMLLQRRARSSV